MINPAPINVHINVFEGPMDLLLHLIRKDNLDVCDINIAEITKQYLDYLNVMKELNLEVAGEFLVMASTLMQIKAMRQRRAAHAAFGGKHAFCKAFAHRSLQQRAGDPAAHGIRPERL